MFIVSEYCPGGDLKDYLYKKERLSLKKALPVMQGIKDGYKYLFEKSILHRDIKLENILIGSFDPILVKLCDFGASEDSALSTEMFVGTPKYMPYEIITGKMNFTYKADLWSIGICYWELLFGVFSHPFNTDSIEDLKASILKYSGDNLKFPPEPKLPQTFYEFFKEIFQFSPELRLDAEEFFYHPIFNQPDLEELSYSYSKTIDIKPRDKMLKRSYTDYEIDSKEINAGANSRATDSGLLTQSPAHKYLKELRLKVQLIYITVSDWMKIISKFSDPEFLSNILALCILMIGKALKLANRAYHSLKDGINFLEIAEFESLLANTKVKYKFIKGFSHIKKRLKHIEEKLCLALAEKSFSDTFFQEIKKVAFHHTNIDVRVYYKKVLGFIKEHMPNLPPEIDAENVKTLFKKSNVLLKGKHMEYLQMFY